MARADAEIEIAVRGIQQVEAARKKIKDLNTTIKEANQEFLEAAKEQKQIDRISKKDSGRAKQVRSINTLNKNLSRSKAVLNKVALVTEEAAEAARLYSQAQKDLNKGIAEQNKLLGINEKNKNKVSSADRNRFRETKQRIAESPGGRFRRLARGKTQEDRRIRGQVGSSALIGGAFPLLFGQGLGASVGGGLGGAAGGLLGGQFGFALSLVGTSVGAAFDNLAKKAVALGDALRKPTENLELLVRSAGLVGTPLERQVNKLKQLGLEATAADIALARIDEFANVEELKRLSSEFGELSRTLAILSTQTLDFVAGPLSQAISAINDVLSGGSNAFTFRDLVLSIPDDKMKEFNEKVGELIPESKAGRFNPVEQLIDRFSNAGNVNRAGQLSSDILTPSIINTLKKDFSPSSAPAKVEIAQGLVDKDRQAKISGLKQEVELERNRLTQRVEEQNVIKAKIKLNKLEAQIALKKFEAEKTEAGVRKDKLNDQVQELQIQRDLNVAQLQNAEILANPVKSAIIDVTKNIRDLNNAQLQGVQMAQTISSSFEESFSGIIRGTMSVQEAFGNMLNKIADHFLNLAAKLMASKLQSGILGLLGGGLSGGFGGSLFAGTTATGTASQFVGSASFPTFANGGRPPVGRASLVGEKGPELFVPRSSGTIVPNNRLGGGGSTSVVVNVDASGTDVQGDDSGAKELGTLISVAVQGELIKQQRPGGLLASVR